MALTFAWEASRQIISSSRWRWVYWLWWNCWVFFFFFSSFFGSYAQASLFYEDMNEIKSKTQPDLIERTDTNTRHIQKRRSSQADHHFSANMSLVSTDYRSIQREIVVLSASNTVSSCALVDSIASAPFLSCYVNFCTWTTSVIIHIYFQFKTFFPSLPGWFSGAFMPVPFPSSLHHVYIVSVYADTGSTKATSA